MHSHVTGPSASVVLQWTPLKSNSTAAGLLVEVGGGLGGLFCASVSIRKIIKPGDVATSLALSTE